MLHGWWVVNTACLFSDCLTLRQQEKRGAWILRKEDVGSWGAGVHLVNPHSLAGPLWLRLFCPGAFTPNLLLEGSMVLLQMGVTLAASVLGSKHQPHLYSHWVAWGGSELAGKWGGGNTLKMGRKSAATEGRLWKSHASTSMAPWLSCWFYSAEYSFALINLDPLVPVCL